MNLMPPIPPGRRYFRVGLVVIILWLLNLALVAGWVWNEQEDVNARMDKKVEQGHVKQAEVRKRVHEYQLFMKEYGPTLQYRDSVEKLDEASMMWSDSIAILTDHLPGGSQLFQAKAGQKQLDGWADFSTRENAVQYLDELKKDSRVKEAYLDCLGSHCADKDLLSLKKSKGAQVAHFHVILHVGEEDEAPANLPSSDQTPTTPPPSSKEETGQINKGGG
ncbi:hypothetical protein [Marininema halotolerans]|uniref:Uncharacterized protein n=1 Tax=Marininema halotolerans TaxID=1155944 RepID=A0A1I6Q1L0_9BACL|nr:hypothetical protein [Marininema halotolerans]SFS46346.1 hypothetical protein SAMN05444972_102277 [Marininema halotolerans]